MSVHASHCCAEHGCKYGDEYCPVEAGITTQDYPCEACTEDQTIERERAVCGHKGQVPRQLRVRMPHLRGLRYRVPHPSRLQTHLVQEQELRASTPGKDENLMSIVDQSFARPQDPPPSDPPQPRVIPLIRGLWWGFWVGCVVNSFVWALFVQFEV